MSDLKKAYEYLDSFEEVDVIAIDSHSDRIIVGPVEYSFLIITGTYIESNWGISLVSSGVLAG